MHVPHLEAGLHGNFALYNCERPRQSLSYPTPAEIQRLRAIWDRVTLSSSQLCLHADSAGEIEELHHPKRAPLEPPTFGGVYYEP